MSAEAKNLEAISKAVVQHNGNCDGQIVEIRLNPFEVERLGWDEILGIPVVGHEKVATGRFNLVCSNGHGRTKEEIEEETLEQVKAADVEERELVPVGAPPERVPWGVPDEFDSPPAFDPQTGLGGNPESDFWAWAQSAWTRRGTA